MGNFQCNAIQKEKNEPLHPPPFPAAFYAESGMRPSDEVRDSSFARAVVDPAISRTTGAAGLPLVRMTHRSGASCDVYLLGATVTSYRLPGGFEVLYLPKHFEEDLEAGHAISGGIPVIFPQFGHGGSSGLPGVDLSQTGLDSGAANAAMPAHGFARLLSWEVNDVAFLTHLFF
jgi:D-hexose-6-phosphate mutarotase